MEPKLSGIRETLLIPLYIRASESERSDAIIRDLKAVKIVSGINYDFTRFKSARLSHLGVSIRTMLLDKALTAFLKKNKDAIIINLGAGLDTRRERLQLYNNYWYDLDVPEVIGFRKNFFSESDYCRFISKSMFDFSWMDEVENYGRPVILIAEGLFMYFEEDELKGLMQNIADRFSGSEMFVEVMGPLFVGRSKRHDTLSKIDSKAEFKWGVKDSRELTKWHPGIQYIEEWCYFDYHKNRAGLVGYIVRLPFIRQMIAPRIVHLKFRSNG